MVQEPPRELLKPTKLNLFGLDIRFRYTEELLNQEKEKRRLTSVSKATGPKAEQTFTKDMLEKIPKSIVTSKRMRSFNRHALPDEIKSVVAPQPVILDRKEPGDVPKPPHMRALTENVSPGA